MTHLFQSLTGSLRLELISVSAVSGHGHERFYLRFSESLYVHFLENGTLRL